MPVLLRRAVDEASIDWLNHKVWLVHDLPREERMGITAFINAAERRLVPASSDQRKAIIGQMATVFPARDDSQGVWKVRFDAYHKALADMPADLLQLACDRLIQRAKWFPKPVEIRQAVERELAKRIMDLTRLRAMHEFEVAKFEQPREPSQEERERKRRVIEAAMKGM